LDDICVINISTDYTDYTDLSEVGHGIQEPSNLQTYSIIGCAQTVHRELGCGFLEAVYQEALAIELSQLNVPFRQEVSLAIQFKNRLLKTSYKADFVCYDSIIIELKAIQQIGSLEQAQLLNYLKASGLRTGLLLNFGATSLQIKRMVK